MRRFVGSATTMTPGGPSRWCAAVLVALVGCGPMVTNEGDDPQPVVDGPTAGQLLPSEEGSPEGPATSQMIGPSGGELVSDDGRVSVTVPPGALDAPVMLSLVPISSTAPGALGQSVRLSKPANVTFKLPVTLSFLVRPSEANGLDPSSVGLGVRNADGFWEKRPAQLDASKRRIVGTTTHFSDWSALAGRQLKPGVASVRTGRQVELQVQWCEALTSNSSPCVPGSTAVCLVARCRASSLSGSLFSDWSVNGQPGGSSATGTVAGRGAAATYVAPSTVPSPATVAVSVKLGPVAAGEPTSLMVSNITVVDDPGYDADFYFYGLVGGTIRGFGRARYEVFEELPDVSRYKLAGGSFDVELRYPDCDPVRSVTLPADEGEGAGTLVRFNERSTAGLTYFWSTSAKTVDVPMSCGSPRTSVVMPVTLTIDVPERAYQTPVEFFGTEAGLPLGGKVRFFFERTRTKTP